MDRAKITKHFVFNNQADELYPLLMEVTDFLKSKADINDVASFKLKFIVTELLTNAIKHSCCLDSFIDVIIEGREITIIKSDLGNTFLLTIDGIQREWPLPGRHVKEQSVRIYGDDTYTLMAKIENNCGLSFFIEEQVSPIVAATDITKLSEHFGLMIITRACDKFEYKFDLDSCSNNFIATVKI